MGNFFIGLGIGIVGTAVAAFFIAKNNTKKLLKAFATVDGLPQKAREIISSKIAL
jgi:gas vesicle protein